jgi:hypothetical protein
MAESESFIPGFKIRARYILTGTEKDRLEELYAIKSASEAKLRAVQQRMLDAERLIHGMMTQIKWDKGFPDSDAVIYDTKTGEIQSLEADPHVHNHG